jgi:hypothetical protein
VIARFQAAVAVCVPAQNFRGSACWSPSAIWHSILPLSHSSSVTCQTAGDNSTHVAVYPHIPNPQPVHSLRVAGWRFGWVDIVRKDDARVSNVAMVDEVRHLLSESGKITANAVRQSKRQQQQNTRAEVANR